MKEACDNTNATGDILQVDGFSVEGTGGGCTGLVKHEEINGFSVEFLIVDDNLSHPDSFPCEISSWFIHGKERGFMGEENCFLDGQIVEDMEEIKTFILNSQDYVNQHLTPDGILACNND